MVETIESKIRKLEGKAGPTQDEDISFSVFLIKPKKDGTYARREWPDGKYSKVDAKALGIEPYTPTTKHAPKVVEPPVAIAVPEARPAPITESPAERMVRIQQMIDEDFGYD